jgi:hypothetical protein
VQPSGWRLGDRASGDERRAVSYLGQDLDALEEVADGYAGLVKVQLAGPWTLAASLELPHGDKALADPGACRDLAASLAEAAAGHVADVRRRLPRADVVLQLDEPSLPAALAGRVRTASGFGALRAVAPPVAQEGLTAVVAAAECAGARVVVHCCAADVPIALLRRSGASGISLDATLLTPRADDAVGEAVEAGVALLMGVVPATGAEAASGARPGAAAHGRGGHPDLRARRRVPERRAGGPGDLP